MGQPLVSAVILSYNEERYLGEAIESVLAQTHPNFEIVVVDNGSSDGSRDVAAGYAPRVRLEVEAERGICPARNAGLRAATGEYLAFLDGDDLWEASKTEKQLAALDEDPGLDYVLAHAIQFLSPDRAEEMGNRIDIPTHPRPGQFIGAMLAPRRTWERVGPWTENLTLSDGLDWFLRAGRLGLRHRMLPEVMVRRRVHGGNESIRNRGLRAEYARVLKNAIDACREGAPE